MLRQVLHSSRPALSEALTATTAVRALSTAAASSSSLPSSSSSSSSRLDAGPSSAASTSRRCLAPSTAGPSAPRRSYSSPSSSRPNNPNRSSNLPSPRITPLSTLSETSQWFAKRFPALKLPEDLVGQVVTHESWDMGMGTQGHSRRLAFLGRRVLSFYLTLFLTSRPSSVSLLTPALLDEALATTHLGSGVGKDLSLEQVLRWTPAISDGQKGPKETGLWKIRGTAVEALVGAIYHQHGAAVARAFFQSKILPGLGLGSTQAVQKTAESSSVERAIEEEAREGEKVLMALESEARGESVGETALEGAKRRDEDSLRRNSIGSASTGARAGAASIDASTSNPAIALSL